jgi:hypothetical protein
MPADKGYWSEGIPKAWSATWKIVDGRPWASVAIALLVFLVGWFIWCRIKGSGHDSNRDKLLDFVIGVAAILITGIVVFVFQLLIVLPAEEHEISVALASEDAKIRAEDTGLKSTITQLQNDDQRANDKLDTIILANGATPTGGLNEKLNSFVNDFEDMKRTVKELAARQPPPPDRHLTDTQRARLVSLLTSAGSYPIAVRYAHLNSEVQEYADELKSVFTNAGWKVGDPPVLLGETAGQGVRILFKDKDHLPPGALSLYNALLSVGIQATGNPMPSFSDQQLELYIGYP